MQSMIPYKIRKENVRVKIENKTQHLFRTPNFLDDTVLTEVDHEFIQKEILTLDKKGSVLSVLERSEIYSRFTSYCYDKMYKIYLDVKEIHGGEPRDEITVKNRFRMIYETEYNYYLDYIRIPYNHFSSVKYNEYSYGAAYTLCIAIKLGMLDICRTMFEGRSF